MQDKKTRSRLEKLNILGSIRAKYILTFVLLLSMGFLLLSLVVSSLITNYTLETRRKNVDESAVIISTMVENLAMTTGKSYSEILHDYSADIQSVCDNLTAMNGNINVIADGKGEIVLYSSTKEAGELLSDYIHPDDFKILSGDIRSLEYSDLSGLYSSRSINHSRPLVSEDGTVEGLIIVSAPLSGIEAFMQELIKTMVIAYIWIIFAAVIVSVFISERIVSPLKEMKKAAKSYSAGNYDVRVPETGVDNEVAELAKAFNSMSREIKEKEQLQTNFLGSVSHDMRTPMTSIAGFVDGILDGTIPEDKREYYLKIVSAETHRLSRLVGSLLDITRIQSGERKFNMTEFDVCELLRLILISMESQIDSKNIEIEFDTCSDKCFVSADRDGIHQVAYNLIHNAIKFTEPGGTVRIGVERSDSKKYLVTVYNTGKGIKKEELPYVFDRFYKTDPSRGLDKSGAGLGLFIVKTILASHGESIEVNSEEDKYCEFSFTLALAKRPKSEKGDSSERSRM